MKKVTFNWPGVDARTISAADFKAVGVEDQNQVVFDTRVPGGATQEVSDDAAKYLVDNDSFEYAKDDDDDNDDAGEEADDTDTDDPTKAEQVEAAGTDSATASVAAEGDTGAGSPRSTRGSARP